MSAVLPADVVWQIKTADPRLMAAWLDNDCPAQEVVFELSGSPEDEKIVGAASGATLPFDLYLAPPGWTPPPAEAAWRDRIAALRAQGGRRWEISHWAALDWLGGADAARAAGVVWGTDWPLYALNRHAAQQWFELGAAWCVLSPEDEGRNLCALTRLYGARLAVPVFQHTPLFQSVTPPAWPPETAAAAEAGGFREARGRSDRRYRTTQRHGLCETFQESPFSLGGRLRELYEAGARRFRVDLLRGTFSADEVRVLCDELKADRAPPGAHVGNYDRGLA